MSTPYDPWLGSGDDTEIVEAPKGEMVMKTDYKPTYVEVNALQLAQLPEKKKRKIVKHRPNKNGTWKILSDNSRSELSQKMKDMSTLRAPIVKEWTNMNNVYDTQTLASSAWLGFLRSKGEDTLSAFGLDHAGRARRKQLLQEDFSVSGGAGKFKRYYIANGILRGGLTARGKNHGNMYSIPIKPNGDKRVLQSLQAKYTNPFMFPSTRIIKFIRGHWGQSSGENKYEAVW